MQWAMEAYGSGVVLDEDLVMEYMTIYLDKGSSYSTANQIRNAVTKVLEVSGKEHILRGSRFKQFLKGYKNLTLTRKKQRMPIRKHDLCRLNQKVLSTSLNLQTKERILVAYLLGYTLLLRISEVLVMREDSLRFIREGDKYSIRYTLHSSKTAQNQTVHRLVEVPQSSYTVLNNFWSKNSKDPWGEVGSKILNEIITETFATEKGFYSFHSLRHGGARDLYSPRTRDMVMYIGRWKSWATLKIYLGIS